MQKLETELWNHTMVRASHAAYTDRFHELSRLVLHLKAVQISGALTDEAVRNGSIKKVKKRGNIGEPSKDRSGRDDNKRTSTRNTFATNPVRRENMVAWPKCTTCNSYHAPGRPCRTCFNCNHSGHLAKDYRGVPRNVNPVYARNLTVKVCYKCGSIGHVRPTCPRLNRAQGPGGNHPNQVAANNGDQVRRNQGNQAKGMAFMLGEEEARKDPNIVTGMDWSSNHKAEIICHEKVVRIPLPDGKLILGAMPVAKSPYRLAPSELEELSGQLKELQDKGEACRTLKGNRIHVDSSKIEAVKNWKATRTPTKIELFNDYDCEIRYHHGKANMVADALSRKEIVKPKKKGLDEMIEQRSNRTLYYLDRIWVPLKGVARTLIMDEAHKSKYSVHLGADKMYYDLRDRYWWHGKGYS
uniref:CCHC-type domain-containing protein n=1 Tax=Tanacetum cinerariifolium TaxID=118510 RepID=A0A699HX73_TANCI|nr:hypothetical protein [Tanacetum cinerariifolium]